PRRDGEMLAMDVARDGPLNAPSVLVVSSACPGGEGICGSGERIALLHGPAWHKAARGADDPVLYVHGLSPHSDSWWRRTARAKAWWGDITSCYDGSSTSAVLTGLMTLVAYEESAQAEFTAMALEYGTLP